MRELVKRARRNQAALLQDFQVPVPRNFSQRQHRLGLQNLQFALKIPAAIRDLLRQGLVLWWGAPASRADIRVLQLQPIIAVEGSWLIRKARFVQRRVKKITRAVTREHPPRAIRSMRCGRQPEYQQLRACVSESGNRLSPVRPLAIRAPLFPRHFLAVAHQTRTLPASLDFLIQDTKLRELFRHEPTMTGVSSFALDR